MSSRVTAGLREAPVYAALIALGGLFLLPFYLIVRNALMPQAQLTSFGWSWFAIPPRLTSFIDLFTDPSAPMATGILNSAIIAVVTVVLSMLFASMAGYALARIPYRGRNVVFFAILSALMIPNATTFVLTYVVVGYLGGIDTLWGIIVPGLFNVFATFLFRQHYLNFPTDIEDAGRVDGLGYWGIYRRLMLPSSRGVMTALGVLAFIGSWNSFLWPLVIGQSQSSWTVQVVLSTFLTAQTINLPELFAGAAVGIAPLVVVFLILQRYIVRGVTMSGVQGQ
jgi:multiple sugar transport system permease protein